MAAPKTPDEDLISAQFETHTNQIEALETRVLDLEQHASTGGYSDGLTSDEIDRLRMLLARWFPHEMTVSEAAPSEPIVSTASKLPPPTM